MFKLTILALILFFTSQGQACVEDYEMKDRQILTERITTNFEMGVCGYGKIVNIIDFGDSSKSYVNGIHNILKAQAYTDYSGKHILKLIIQPKYFEKSSNDYALLNYRLELDDMDDAFYIKKAIVEQNASVAIHWKSENAVEKITAVKVVNKETTKTYKNVKYIK
jgi:hypothetical protein